MQKYLCIHTFSPGKYSSDQIKQFSQAAQIDPGIKGYRSFANLSKGKMVCVIEASSEESLQHWFKKMGMPFDSITSVEWEGERGEFYLV